MQIQPAHFFGSHTDSWLSLPSPGVTGFSWQTCDFATWEDLTPGIALKLGQNRDAIILQCGVKILAGSFYSPRGITHGREQKGLGRSATPFGVLCASVLWVPLQCQGATSPPIFYLSSPHFPSPIPMCSGNPRTLFMGETSHFSHGLHAHRGIAVASVTGHFGLELFLAALSVSQRQGYEVKLSD